MAGRRDKDESDLDSDSGTNPQQASLFDHILKTSKLFNEKSLSQKTKNDLIKIILELQQNIGMIQSEMVSIDEYGKLEERCEELQQKSVCLEAELMHVKSLKYDEIMSQKTPSYSDILKKAPIPVPTKQINEQTIIIKAISPINSTEVQCEAYDHIKTMQNSSNKFKINKIIKTKTGMLIKTPMNENIDQLIEEFKANDKINHTSYIYKSKMLDPTIVLKKVNKLTDPTSINKIICSMNNQLENCEDDIKVLFPIKSQSSCQDIVLRVSPKVYQIINKTKQVYTDIELINVKDKVLVKQCQKCFQFNAQHKQNDCHHNFCAECATDGPHKCSHNLKCINCSKHTNQQLKQHCDHKANSPQCPLYQTQINRTKDRTCYALIPPNTSPDPGDNFSMNQ